MALTRAPATATDRVDALVIGGGPAGLMAAEMLADAGCRTLIAEAMPTVGRKLLMAGKSGLNLTMAEPAEPFLSRYDETAPMLAPMLSAFGPDEVQAWARGLGQPLFTGSTGRVFPHAMKSSGLLRAWLARLGAAGVTVRTSWRWTGALSPAGFDTRDGPRRVEAAVTVLALGGASWRRLGSDGAWAPWLAAAGVPVSPFGPSNVGVDVHWSPYMSRHFGSPVKAVAFRAGARESRGEAVISARGLEGGGLYPLTPALRTGEPLTVDLLPDLTAPEIASRLARPRARATRAAHLRRTLRLDPVRLALLQEFGRPLPDGAALAALIKRLPVRHAGLRPLDEAISTCGGVRWSGVGPDLMLTAMPGIFVAGEMLDWEAPTGGYLLTACLATGRWAGRAAAERCLSGAPSSPDG